MGTRRRRSEERIYVAGEKEHENEQTVPEEGIPVKPNLRDELHTTRDQLDTSGYEDHF